MSLPRWIDAQDFDLAFYERSWNLKIMAGIYILRNTKFAHEFLQLWVNCDYLKPTGFHSSGNGAIRLAVLEDLAVQLRHYWCIQSKLGQFQSGHFQTGVDADLIVIP
jgi:Protein of unknown function, DUF273